MHEHGLAAAILDAAVRHGEGRRVTRVDVTVGALRQVVGDTLEFHFEILARGTACEGARLVLEMRPARLRCSCGAEWELSEPTFRCERCEGGEVRVMDGEQLRVESIEVLDGEESPGAPDGKEGRCTAAR